MKILRNHTTQAIILFLLLSAWESYSEPVHNHGQIFKTSAPDSPAPAPEERGICKPGEACRYQVVVIDFPRVSTPFLVAAYIFFIGIAKIGYHMIPVVPEYLPESSFLMLLGIILGLCLYYSTRSYDGKNAYPDIYSLSTDPTIFFFFLFPPIILDAGYFMPNRLFFDHLGTILLMAIIGTVLNAVTIGFSLWGCGLTGIFTYHFEDVAHHDLSRLEILLFASLISAVDPVAVLAVFDEVKVNEVLYIVVFGESLLNDGVTVVLFNMFKGFLEMIHEGAQHITFGNAMGGVGNFFIVALGGTAWGILWGLMCGFVTRFTHHARIIEPVFVFATGYLAYMNAELFEWSSILSITFCGITMKNYVVANVSRSSRDTIQYMMKMMANIAECLVFLFLGVEAVRDNHDWNWAFVCLTILFCCVYRVVVVAVLVWLANRFRILKLEKIEQAIMMYGGLRGAVAYYMVSSIKEELVHAKQLFSTTTLAVIYFTVFFQGITVKPLVKWLGVKRAQPRDRKLNERIHEKAIDHAMGGLESLAGHEGDNFIRFWFKFYEEKLLRPILIREKNPHEPTIMKAYENVQMDDAMSYVKRTHKTKPKKAPGDTDSSSSSSESDLDVPQINITRPSIVSDLLDVDFPIPGIDTFGGHYNNRTRTFTVDSQTGQPRGIRFPWNTPDDEDDEQRIERRARRISISRLAEEPSSRRRAMSQPLYQHPLQRKDRQHSVTPYALDDFRRERNIPVGLVKPTPESRHQDLSETVDDLSKTKYENVDLNDVKPRTFSSGSASSAGKKAKNKVKPGGSPRHKGLDRIISQEMKKSPQSRRAKISTGSFNTGNKPNQSDGFVNPAFEGDTEAPPVAPRRPPPRRGSTSSSSD